MLCVQINEFRAAILHNCFLFWFFNQLVEVGKTGSKSEVDIRDIRKLIFLIFEWEVTKMTNRQNSLRSSNEWWQEYFNPRALCPLSKKNCPPKFPLIVLRMSKLSILMTFQFQWDVIRCVFRFEDNQTNLADI